MSIEEKYNLTASNDFKLTGREEIDQNLDLDNSEHKGAPINGKTTTIDGTKIPNATIKIFDFQGKPYEHTKTDINGNYSFIDIPDGSYYITSSLKGYLTPTRIPFTVTLNKSVVIPDLIMNEDTRATKSAIYGIVSLLGTNIKIQNAVVQLIELQNEIEINKGFVKTNDDGQYLFADLPSGTYCVIVNKNGYQSQKSAFLDIEDEQYGTININLVEDPITNTGTVSGIVTDKNTKLPVPNALVALYKINENGNETIIKFTRTTSEGLYLFGDLPSAKYKVKATFQD